MHTIISKKVQTVRKFRKLGRGTLSSMRENQDGATAIEFAILGVPFFALLFGILEIAVLFFITSTTHHAVAEVSRQVRTGEFQSTGGGADEFKEAICDAMFGVGNCDNLRIDVISSSTGQFTDLSLPVSPASCSGNTACEAEDPNLPEDTYSTTEGGDVVIVRVQYTHHLSVPNKLTRLSNAPGNTHVISATTAFKNEPF